MHERGGAVLNYPILYRPKAVREKPRPLLLDLDLELLCCFFPGVSSASMAERTKSAKQLTDFSKSKRVIVEVVNNSRGGWDVLTV